MRMFLNNPLNILCLSVFLLFFFIQLIQLFGIKASPLRKLIGLYLGFNNTLGINFFKPVAKAWREVPTFLENTLTNLATTT